MIKDKKINCIYCKKPIYIGDYGGECKEGSFHKDCFINNKFTPRERLFIELRKKAVELAEKK